MSNTIVGFQREEPVSMGGWKLVEALSIVEVEVVVAVVISS